MRIFGHTSPLNQAVLSSNLLCLNANIQQIPALSAFDRHRSRRYAKSMAKQTAKQATKKATRKIRFEPDPGTLAEIRFDQLGLVVFGLVLNESSGGCAVVVSMSKKMITGTTCRCKVGHLSWADAEVRWSKKVDTNLWKIGLEYHL